MRRARSARGRLRRFVVGVVVATCATAWPGRPRASAGEDAEIPAFCERFADATWIDRIAAGPDGSVCVAGRTMDPALPGALASPKDQLGGDFVDGGFVTVFEPDGRVRWTRYLFRGFGGVGGVRVARDGSVWTAANLDCPGITEVTKFAPDGTMLVVEDFGGVATTVTSSVAIAANGDAIVVGTTNSAAFPTASAFQPAFGGGTDGFVARLHGDGSGIAWSSYLGGPMLDDASAVAIDAAGDLLVTTRARSYDSYIDLLDHLLDSPSAALTRISGDGALVDSALLPVGKFAGRFDIAVAPDGWILVSGAHATDDWSRYDGFVLSIDPVTLATITPWTLHGRTIDRISIGPDGSVLLSTDRYRNDPTLDFEVDGGFVLLSPDLTRVLRRVDREEGWGVRDVAFAPDGALCVAGRNSDAAVRFHEPADGNPSYLSRPFVARLPVAGAAPPSHVRARSVTATSAELEWPRDGDPVVSYEIEERRPFSDSRMGSWTYRSLKRLPPSAVGVRLSGLTPAAEHHVRLVAEFASGVRISVGAPTIRTPPAPLRSVRAYADPRRGNVIEIRGPAHGDRSMYEVERSVDGGPFVRIRRIRYDWRICDPACDGFVHIRDDGRALRGAVVVYRARASSFDPRIDTAWRYSSPVWMR